MRSIFSLNTQLLKRVSSRGLFREPSVGTLYTAGSPELAIYRLSPSRLLAIRARLRRLEANSTLLIFALLLALLSSWVSSTIRTSRTFIGGARTVPAPVWPPWVARARVYFHRSPGLPYTHSRVVPTRASPARSPLVTVPDRSKGLYPQYSREYYS